MEETLVSLLWRSCLWLGFPRSRENVVGLGCLREGAWATCGSVASQSMYLQLTWCMCHPEAQPDLSDIPLLAHKGEGHACLGFCQESPGFMKHMQTCNLLLEMLPVRLPQGLCYCWALKIWFCGAEGVGRSSCFTNNSTACCGGRIN